MPNNTKIQAGVQLNASVEGTSSIVDLSKEIEATGIDTSTLSKEAEALNNTFKQLETRQQLISQFRTLKTESNNVAVALAAAQNKAAELAQQMRENPSAELQRDFQATIKEARQLKEEQSALSQRLQILRNDMNAAGINSRQLASAERQIGTESTAAQAKLQGLTEETQRLKKLAAARVRLGLDVDTKGQQQIRQLTADYRALRESGTLTSRELSRATELYSSKLKQLRGEASGTPSALNPIAESIRGIGSQGLAIAGVGGGLYAVKEGIQAILDKTIEFQGIRQRLDYAFGGVEEGGKQFAFVKDIANQLGLEVVGAANGYAQLAAATKDLNITTEQTQQIFTGVSSAVAGMHLTAEDAKGVFLALSQIAGKGKVSMEELRQQLGERLTPAMGIAAKAMGVTSAELEKMVETGISAKEFLPKFGAALQQAFAGEAAANVNTLNGQINILKNQFSELLNNLGEGGVADGAIKVLQDIGNMMESLEGQIDSMDATISGSMRDSFVSFYDLLKDAGSTIYDVFNTAIDMVNDLGKAFDDCVGLGGQDFDILKGILNGIHITIGAIQDGFSAIGIVVKLVAGVAMDACGMIAAGLSKITFGDMSKNFEKAAMDLHDSAVKYYGKAEKAALDFKSKTIEYANKATENQEENYRQLESDARETYQKTARAAIAAAKEAQEAHQRANAAIGTDSEETAKKQAEAADKAAQTAQSAALKAQKNWVESAQTIRMTSKDMDAVTKPLKDAGFVSEETAVKIKKIPQALIDAKGAADDMGLSVRAAMNEPAQDITEMVTKTNKMAAGFDEMKKAGIDAGSLVRQAMDKMLSTANNEADINAVKAEFKSLGHSGHLSMQEVEQGIIDADIRLQELKGTLDPVAKAFKKLGIQTKEALKLSAESMKNAFETARQSGQGTAEGMEQAFKRAADAALASGDAQMKAWVDTNASMYGYKVAVDDTGKSILEQADKAEKSSERQVDAINKATDATKKQADATAEVGNANKSASNDMKSFTKMQFVYWNQSVHTTESLQEMKKAVGEVSKGWSSLSLSDDPWQLREMAKLASLYEKGLVHARDVTDSLIQKTEAGTVSMGDIAIAASAADMKFGKLDKTTLSNLQSAIDKAGEKMRALRDDASQTLSSLETELASMRGEDTKSAQLEQEAKLRELNNKLADAQRAGDGQSIVDYQKSIRLQKELFTEKQRQAEEEKQAAAEKAAQEEANKAAAAQPVPQTVVNIGDASVPVSVTDDMAKQLASGLQDALSNRDKQLVDKVIQEVVNRLQDEFKRMGR